MEQTAIKLRILISIIIIFLLIKASHGKTLILAVEEWPPYEYDNGKKGIVVDIVKEISKEENIPVEI